MPAQFRDYYESLGVEKSASQDEIRSAFRRLARKHHPDVAKDKKASEEKFKEINEAYEVLSDPEKRKKYDEYGRNWEHAGAGGFPGGGMPHTGGQGPFGGGGADFEFSGTGFSDFFEHLFGARQGRGYRREAQDFGFAAGPQRGQDIEADLLVTLEEAFSGSTRQISLRSRDGGVKTYTIKIPKGVREGQRIRLAGLGEQGGGGGTAGDVYLRVKFQKHPDFRVEGSSIYHSHEIAAHRAVLGCTTEVHTLEGRVRLKIPAGSQAGQMFRLPGKGLPEKEGGRGDFFVVLEPQLPKILSAEERELWEKIAALHEH